MVKRPKTPETDVTGKLLIIFKPYPNADCLVEEDRIALARWVAEVINQDHIVTIWNRPNTQSLIMVEVLKETEHVSFLGEHRWAEFLKDPRPDEIDNVSQVFYSAYPNDREAQKKGWKQVDVQEFWFDDFERGQGAIKQPYPATRWCPVPPNASHVTGGASCRPLPVGVKPPPPPVKAPVPGSEEYWSARGLAPPSAGAGSTGSSSGPSTAPGTPLPTAPTPLPESWPTIGNQHTAKKPAAKPTPATNNNGSAGNGAGGKKKGVKVGLAQFAATTTPAGPSSWNKVASAASGPKAQGPITSKDPPPSANPPKERINAWGTPAPTVATSLHAPPLSNKSSVSSSISGATNSSTDQAPKKGGWGEVSSKPYKPQKRGEQPKADDDSLSNWSSVKSRQHSASSKATYSGQSPTTETTKQWADYEDDGSLPELEIETKEETKVDYDPWAVPAGDAGASAPVIQKSASPAAQAPTNEGTRAPPSPLPPKPSTIPQAQVYEEIWGDDAPDSNGGAEWTTKGKSKGKRGRGRGNNNNLTNGDRDRGRDDAWRADNAGGNQSWAPKSGPDSRGTVGNRGNRGRGGRGAKLVFESGRHQLNGSWVNKGKQKAAGDVDEQQREGGNSGSSGRSSPGSGQALWAPDAPPHVRSPDEGSSSGAGAASAHSSEEAYDHTTYWSGVEPIAETTEDVYESFASAPRVEYDARQSPPSPGTPASPTRKRTPVELQEEYDRLYKEHCAVEKRRIEQIICTTHHIVCKKGVCKDIAKIWRVEQNKVDEKFKPPPHLRHLLKGKGGKRQGWNKGDQRRVQQDSDVVEGDERQQRGGRPKVEAVDGYQVMPSASDW